MIQVWKIDEQGWYLESTMINEEDITEFDITEAVNTNETNTFYKPRRINNVWVEGWTQAEIDAWNLANAHKHQEPSTEDVLLNYVADLDYRLSLKEMGV